MTNVFKHADKVAWLYGEPDLERVVNPPKQIVMVFGSNQPNAKMLMNIAPHT